MLGRGQASANSIRLRPAFLARYSAWSARLRMLDALSSAVMINNDRILGNVANAALLVEVPALLTD